MPPLPHRYVRHRSPESLVKEFNPRMSVDDKDELLGQIKGHGMWAFVRIPLGKNARKHKCVINWWARRGQPDSEVALMLGHELGHISGKQARGFMAEENRADAYGEVAREVFLRLTRARRAPAGRRRGRPAVRTSRRASSRAGR